MQGVSTLLATSVGLCQKNIRLL